MKRIIAIIMALAMVFSLCACESLDKIGSIELPPLPTETPEPTEAATPEPTVQAAETKTEASQRQVIVSINRTEKKVYDPQNGLILILTFSFESPAVYVEGYDDATERINEYSALLDESYYTGEDYGDGQGTGYNNMLTQAEDNYNYLYTSGITDGMYEMVSSRTVTVQRCDSQILTLLYTDYSFTGGAHGFYGNRAYCFDTDTGDVLTLDMLSSDTEALKSLLTEYMVTTTENDASISERIDQTLIPDGDYEAVFSTLLRDGSWYFGRDGLVVFSDLYEISSYAAGPIEFTVPYDSLEGVIDDKWIPAALTNQGGFTVVDAKDMVDGSTEIIDKLKIGDNGHELYLVAQGDVRDVKVSSVDYTDAFYETAELWHCSDMNDSALQLETVIPEGMPDLMISYSDKDGRHNLLLTESGEDGSLILMDDSIEAVG